MRNENYPADGGDELTEAGSEKSQMLHQHLAQIAQHKDEAAIVYDPAREFIEAHYKPLRGDIILNPLDQRSPLLSPAFECRERYKTDYMTMADSFFPGRGDRMTPAGRFFNGAARDIFARMMEFDPDPETLIIWLSDEKQIARLTDGTELARYIDPAAKVQKGGVLSTLAQIGETLRFLVQEEAAATPGDTTTGVAKEEN
jgi:Type IV secretion-system coupling protein DNA-binding domain